MKTYLCLNAEHFEVFEATSPDHAAKIFMHLHPDVGSISVFSYENRYRVDPNGTKENKTRT